jgi:hypothetical protein
MPRILVITEPVQKPDAGVMLDEQIATTDISSDHFARHLIERIGWALADAESTEHHALTCDAPVASAPPAQTLQVAQR